MKRLSALLLLMLMFAVGMSSKTYAHGGVSVDDDGCVMSIGPYRAHFTGYQPELRATQEFCEDIPEVAPAIIVLDFIDNVLRKQDMSFYLLRDVKGLGKKARYEDLGSMDAVRSECILCVEPEQYPRGTITLDFPFAEGGWYIGVLEAHDAESGETYHSVFPFQVGVRHYWGYVIAGLIMVGLSVLLYIVTGRKKPQPEQA